MRIEAMSLVGMADKDNQTGESNQWADAEWLGRARWEVLRFLTSRIAGWLRVGNMEKGRLI